ncbi:DUF6292 family protein [Bailinhaonella thermotolerans]|uniref:DUF6292 domain-containing protein n=1 Tax=Bailinhaonella thermotolerans TaxID=1070861 RepID=A0A3A4AZH5_9ACTN|nr:DUF6292 family protein [Bailinhaonella thermotolerans]RJL35787.1 hypothetical protein D5H75_03110 [Bailinhaonella thermotolerans]
MGTPDRTDPRGHVHRADPRGYVQAVAAALAELGLENGGAVPDDRPGGPRRVLVIHFDGGFGTENINFADAEALRLGWDEERGWTLQEVLPGRFRPFRIDYHDLGLGLVPEPSQVAEVVRRALGEDLRLRPGEGPRLRRAADDDPALEAALAPYA